MRLIRFHGVIRLDRIDLVSSRVGVLWMRVFLVLQAVKRELIETLRRPNSSPATSLGKRLPYADRRRACVDKPSVRDDLLSYIGFHGATYVQCSKNLRRPLRA